MQFVPTAFLYTCAYAMAVVADHASSLAAMKAGAVETNVLFQTPGHALAEGRAVVVFLLLWPVMLGLLWLADRRARGLLWEPGWLVRQLIGHRPETTALLPIVAIFGKLFAAAGNMVIAIYGFSIYTPIRGLLSSANVTDWNAQSLLCGLALLLPAFLIGWLVARWWYGRGKVGRRPAASS